MKSAKIPSSGPDRASRISKPGRVVAARLISLFAIVLTVRAADQTQHLADDVLAVLHFHDEAGAVGVAVLQNIRVEQETRIFRRGEQILVQTGANLFLI